MRPEPWHAFLLLGREFMDKIKKVAVCISDNHNEECSHG